MSNPIAESLIAIVLLTLAGGCYTRNEDARTQAKEHAKTEDREQPRSADVLPLPEGRG